MPDPRQKLYSALSGKFDLGSYEEFSAKMDNPESRKKLYGAVSTKFDLGSFDEFESKVASVKKKDASQPTSAPQKSASEPKNGSLASLGPKDPFAPVETFVPAPKKVKTSKEKNNFVPGSVAYAHQQNKEENPRYSQLYNEYVAAGQVPDERKAAIQQEVEDEASGTGIMNNLISGGKKAWNFAADALTTIGSFGTETKAPEAVRANIDPLQSEKEQAKKELQDFNAKAKASKKPVQPITQDQITERAKSIAVKKRIDSESESRVRDYLAEADEKGTGIGSLTEKQYLEQYLYGERASMSEKDKLDLKKQEILKPAIDNTLKGLENIKAKAAEYAKNKQPVPEELSQEYDNKYQQYKALVDDAVRTREEFVNRQENLGNLQDNIDVVKRDYSWGKNFANNLSSATLDLDAGALGALDYLGQFTPTLGAYSDNFRAGSKKLKEIASDERDEIMKPISVDDINGPKDLGRWFAATAAQQVPIFALISTGVGGVATLGATSTGQKYEEMLDEEEAGTAQYSDTQKALIPAAFGATETASAMVDRYLMKGFGRAINSATEPERRLIAEGMWEGLKNKTANVAKAVSKGLIKAPAIESLDEGGTQLAQNLIDIYGGGKTDVGVWDNVKDAAAAGAAIAAFLPLGGAVINKITKPFATDESIQNTSAEIVKLEKTLSNPELSEGSRAILTKQLDNSEAKLRNLVASTANTASNLSDEEFEEVVNIEKRQASLKAQAREIESDPAIEEDVKKDSVKELHKEFEDTETRRKEILNKPTNEQKPNETTEQEAQPQAEEQAPVSEVTNTESNDSQISNPNETGASQDTTTENPNPNQINNPRLTEITDKLDGLYEKLIGNGMTDAEAETTALESLSKEEMQILLDRRKNTQQNESIQGEDIASNGDVSVGTAELGTMGEGAGQATEANIGESAQPAVDAGTSESQSEIDPRIQEIEARRQEELTALENNPDAIEDNGSYYITGANGVETSTELINEKYDSELSGLPAIEQNQEATPSEERPKTFEKKKGKKSIVNRIYEGDTSRTMKDLAESLGLNYEVENQEEAQANAEKFVEQAGITNALEAVRSNTIKGAEKAFVYGKILEKINEAIEGAEPGKTAQMEEQYTNVLNEATEMFDLEARESGRFISALNRIYNTSGLKYSLSRQTERYKAANKGVVDHATLAQFEAADKKIKELEKQIAEAENKVIEAEAKLAMENIVEAVERESKSKTTAKQKAKTLANKIRKAKISRPDVFNASVGADKIWDAAIEVVAKTIESGGTLADAVAQGVAYIKKTSWYKGLTKDKKSEALSQFESSLAETNTDEVVTVEDGVINIPNSVVRTLVEMGVRDIDVLSQKILDMVSEEHPDLTLRDVRDAITKYGKTINPTKDEIQKQINLMKRLGKLISSHEDVDQGARPQRSGLQREKPTQLERQLQRELRDKMKGLPQDDAALATQWKNSLDTIKSRLKNQIEDIEKQIKGGEKRKAERTPIEYDEEARLLRDKRDQLRDILDEIAGKPELTDEQKIQRAINATQNAVDKLNAQIESGNIGFNPTPRTLYSPELNALKETRKQLSAELNKMRQEAGLIEKQKLAQAKARVRKSIADLEKKIQDKDYSKKKRDVLEADQELIELQAEKIKQQEVYDRAVYQAELKNRSGWAKGRVALAGIGNVLRILKATGEFSMVGIQGGIQTVNLAIRKPRVFAKAMARLFIAFGSARKADYYNAEIKAQDNYPLMKASKLALVEPDYKLELREEEFIGNYVNNIWNLAGKGLEMASGKIFGVTDTLPVGDKLISFWKEEYKNKPKVAISEQFKNMNPLLALERAGGVYMNIVRSERFNDGVTMLEMQSKNITDDKQEFKNLAAAVNTLTGRANIGRLENISDLLGTIFFSFRNTVSIFNQVNPIWYLTLKSPGSMKPSVAQKVAVYDMMRFISITTSMMYLLQAAAGDDDEGNPKIDIETDPRSSDFMKMRMGNVRFDASHGMNTQIVFFCRQFSDATKSKGEVKQLGTGMFTPTRGDLVESFITNKFSPQAGVAWRYANTRVDKEGVRKTKFGEEYTVAEDLTPIPIYWESINEIKKEDPDAYARMLTVLGIFGMNSQVYETKQAKASEAKTSSPERTTATRTTKKATD